MPVRIGAIAVGGRGSRFGQSNIQKCLIPIEEKPILDHTVEAFIGCGVKLIIFLTGFLQEQISTHLAQTYGSEAQFVPATVYGGTTGIAPAIHTLRHFVDEDFLFAHSDSILKHNTIGNFVHQAGKRHNDLAMMLVSKDIETSPTHAFVKLEATTNVVKAVRLATTQRHPQKQDLVDTGIYYFRPPVFDFLGKVKPDQQLANFIRPAKKAGHTVSAVVMEEPWFCLHTPSDLHRWESVKANIIPSS